MNDIIVDIVLASYNGEKYIKEQIDSILEQTHCNFNLYISDDGSTDSTVDIILDCARKDKRVFLLNKDRVGGVIKNFEKILSMTKSDYIMLSDQDDFWHEDKVKKSLQCILKQEQEYGDIALLGYSDLTLVDEKLKTISESFYKSARLNPLRNLNLNNIAWMGSVMGCTIIMNRVALNNALPFHKVVIMHDHWLAMKTAEIGRLFYMDEILIKYRQHGENVSGGLGFRKTSMQKIFDLKKYSQIITRARIISSIHHTNTIRDRLIFSKKIISGFKSCETIKYPLMFMFFYVFFGKAVE